MGQPIRDLAKKAAEVRGRPDLPTGTVTFLFTDVEGSTRLLHELGAEAYAHALAEHRRVMRDAFGRHGGVEVDTQGDAFFVAFATAQGALGAAREATEALATGPIRVRMGIHTGTPVVTLEGFVGPDVHRAARIAAAGHGRQVLVSSATAGLVGSAGLRDLGEHRLKDLSAAERIYQLGDADFPPLASLYQTNLPVPATPFLGRELEVGEVSALLRRDDVRVVTLTGPGGTGKTRLALQSAGAVGDAFEAGVWWVPLASIRDPQLVLPEAARALGAQGDLAEHMRDQPTLILFDNFEQVTPAAADVARLLAGCPGLKVLVTSREPLHITGEREYAVDPLPESEAVELFMTRALAARRDFAANGEVRQICLRLDNLPLAIELAAARVKVLSPRALLDRLDRRLPLLAGGARDAPERQRTLRATIEWSHDLLAEDEQRLFARLSVFRGGWTLDAAEAVAEADLDILQSLVDKSLVRQRDDRFSMLETIREYAAERVEGQADHIRRRHADYFLAFAERAEPHLRGSPLEWLDRLEAERDNARAAFDYLEDSGDVPSALRLGAALWRFWAMRGYFTEGRRRLDRLLGNDTRPTAARARALNGATALAIDSGERLVPKAYAEEALALHRHFGDRWGTAYSIFLLGAIAATGEDWERARALMLDSLSTFTELGDDHYRLLATQKVAWAHYELGDRGQARTLFEESLVGARAAGNKRMEAALLQALAWIAVDDHRARDAIALLAAAYAIDRELGETLGIQMGLLGFGRALYDMGEAHRALMVISRAVLLGQEIGAEPEVAERERVVAAIRDSVDPAALGSAWEQGQMLTLEEAVALATRP